MNVISKNDAQHAINMKKRITYVTKGTIYEILYVSKFKFPGEVWFDVLSFMAPDGEVYNRLLSDLAGFEFID